MFGFRVISSRRKFRSWCVFFETMGIRLLGVSLQYIAPMLHTQCYLDGLGLYADA